MANSIQTKITNFNFPTTYEQLKTDPAIYDGTIMLHDYSHPSGITETAGYDAQRLNSSLSQFVDISNPSGSEIAGNQDFLISLNFWANSVSSNMTLLGEEPNSGAFLELQPSSGTYGRIAFRMNAPTVHIDFDNEPIRANEFYNVKIQRISNVITFFVNEQSYTASGSDFNNSVDINLIGAHSNDSGVKTAFWDGYIWDVKLQVGTQVGTSSYSLNYLGTGDTPWVNLGTLSSARNGVPKAGTTSPVATSLSRVVIGKDNRADAATIVNLASTEATALGITDTGVEISPTNQPDFGLSAGRGFRLTNALATDTLLKFNKQVSDKLVAVSTAGNTYGMSFWFKPELDTWDSTAIGYFFRWGTSTNTGAYNKWIFLNGSGSTKNISIRPGGNHTWSTYEGVNNGVVNVILTNDKAYINGSLVTTNNPAVALQDFQSGNEHSTSFSLATNQHTSDRNIVYAYRLNFADITTSGVTEAQWVAKEYATGVQYIKAITDTTT